MTKATSWTCPSCAQTVDTAFCARCGEQPPAPRELTLAGLAEKLVDSFTSIDARALRSARLLLRRPGELTVAWIRGVRKPYVAPFQLFLIANVIFFALQSLTGVIVFSSPLESHLHHQDWSALAQGLLARHLAASGIPFEQYAPVFDQAVVVNGKSLILLMTVPFTLALPLLFVRARRPFMTHVVFSLHVYAFLLLLFCATMLGGKASSLLGFGGLEVPAVDNVLSVVNLTGCMLYLYFAIGPVYRTTGPTRIAQAVVLAIAAGAIVLGYRFLLFVVTLYGT